MAIIIPANTLAAGAYSIDNSCRFNSGDSPTLHRTPDASDVDKWTFSIWFKKSTVGTSAVQDFLSCIDGSGNNTVMNYVASPSHDTLNWTEYQGSYLGQYVANAKQRDPSAWYHAVFTWDSDNATAGNRMRIYINGAELTSFSTETNVSQDQDSLLNSNLRFDIGSAGGASSFFHGYFAEIIFCDGQALTPSSFGEFDEDSPTIWKPKDPSGVTFGDNGFWLDFEDSSALGNDVSGNNNDLTSSGLDATDQATDTPTNNFCTMNPYAQVDASGAASSFTFSEGNCKVVGGSPASYVGSTMAVSTGKWYYEMKLSHSSTVINMWFGVRSYDESWGPSGYAEPEGDGTILDGWFWKWGNNGVNTSGASGSDGHVHNNKAGTYTNTATGTALETDDIVGINLDLDNGDTYLQVNGVDVNSGNTVSDLRVDQGFFYTPIVNTEHASVDTTVACSFGGCPAFAITSAVNDGNGYGKFEFEPKSGYLALCSKNLGSDGG